MKMKPTIALLVGVATCSFQAHTAELCDGGFENGGCWTGLTEQFGFSEVSSSYTDGRGITYTPTEGSFFYNFWGFEDLFQEVSWKKGDQLSFDWAVAEGTNPDVKETFVDVGLVERDGVFDIIAILGGTGTAFDRFTYIFTEDSPERSGLYFQTIGGTPLRAGLTDAEVGHILLDNVEITRVPLPGSAFLMITSLLFGYSSRRICWKREHH